MLGLWLVRYTSKAAIVIALFVFSDMLAIVVDDVRPSTWWFALAFGLQIAVTVAVRARAVAEGRAWLAESRAGLVLEAPFTGNWMVAAGGAYPGGNHHIWASDQRFAYDFIRLGKSLDEPILAPCAGRIVAAYDGERDLPSSRNPDRVERGRELGNHVIVEAGDVYVFLCHLREGSVAVTPGQDVTIGTPLGRCGNSGRTTRPHLHIHAQDRPQYDLDEAIGVPIRFRSRNARARVLQKLSVLRA